MKLRGIIAIALALACGPAFAQVNQGTTPLSGSKGGTNNAFMQFTGPATTLKTYTIPNANSTLAALGAIQTWTGAQSLTDGTLILLGSGSGSSTIKAPATGGGTATLFAGSDTIAGIAVTQVLTNKTVNCANNTCTVRIGTDVSGLGTGVATALGNGINTAGGVVVPTAALTANGVVYGGGSAVTPGSTAAGTSGQLFLGVTSGAPQWGTMSGDATITNAGVFNIGANAVSFAKWQQINATSLVGNATGSLANATNIGIGATLAFSGTTLQTVAMTGDVSTAANSFAVTIGANAVSNAKMSTMAANTVKGNATGGIAVPTDVPPATARSSSLLNVDQYTGHGDSIYSILTTDRTVGTNAAFTASRTWTLPAANGVNPGQEIVVSDFQGTVTAVNTLVISRAGADTVNGGTTVTITAANGAYLLKSDGVSKWTAQALGAAAAGGVSSVTCGTGLSGGTITTSGTCAVSLTTATNSLGADVAMNNTSNFFDGPSTAQGTSGTWLATGAVIVTDTSSSAGIQCKLWDGTTTIAGGGVNTQGATANNNIALSGLLASPAANIRISCKDPTSTSGVIKFNVTGTSKDSTLTVVRIN
jgi:hypothetical protein